MDLKKLKQWLRRKQRRPLRDREAPPAAAKADQAAPAAAPPEPSLRGKSDPGGAGDDDGAPDHSVRRPPPAAKRRPKRVLSRRGIPLLKPDEDLARCFLDPDKGGNEEARPAVPDSGAPSPNPGMRGRKRPPARGSRHREPSRNKAGIRRLEGDEDLWGHFLAAEDEGPPDAHEPEQPPPDGRRPPTPRVTTDRHGIPRLDESVDLPRLFADALQDPDEADELGEAFRRSLQQDARSLMKQKTGGRWSPRRLSLKEQLRRYPAPQAQLDLHGDTALKAHQRAESFVRTAAADGRRTLRLIVGKGLHSADGAVLPDVIEDLLVALKRESLVLSFDWDKGVKRKSGAVIVYLTGPF